MDNRWTIIVFMDEEVKKTQVTVRSDGPVGIASQAHGANMNIAAFNLNYIQKNNPVLAVSILKNLKEAQGIKPDDPAYPDEDFDLALGQLEDLL